MKTPSQHLVRWSAVLGECFILQPYNHFFGANIAFQALNTAFFRAIHFPVDTLAWSDPMCGEINITSVQARLRTKKRLSLLLKIELPIWPALLEMKDIQEVMYIV